MFLDKVLRRSLSLVLLGSLVLLSPGCTSPREEEPGEVLIAVRTGSGGKPVADPDKAHVRARYKTIFSSSPGQNVRWVSFEGKKFEISWDQGNSPFAEPLERTSEGWKSRNPAAKEKARKDGWIYSIEFASESGEKLSSDPEIVVWK